MPYPYSHLSNLVTDYITKIYSKVKVTTWIGQYGLIYILANNTNDTLIALNTLYLMFPCALFVCDGLNHPSRRIQHNDNNNIVAD